MNHQSKDIITHTLYSNDIKITTFYRHPSRILLNKKLYSKSFTQTKLTQRNVFSPIALFSFHMVVFRDNKIFHNVTKCFSMRWTFSMCIRRTSTCDSQQLFQSFKSLKLCSFRLAPLFFWIITQEKKKFTIKNDPNFIVILTFSIFRYLHWYRSYSQFFSAIFHSVKIKKKIVAVRWSFTFGWLVSDWKAALIMNQVDNMSIFQWTFKSNLRTFEAQNGKKNEQIITSTWCTFVHHDMKEYTCSHNIWHQKDISVALIADAGVAAAI